MIRLAWLTDIHLNFLKPPQLAAFLDTLGESGADAILIGGDIAEAPNVCHCVQELELRLQRPIYFVLGNHDFYRDSIAHVRSRVAELCRGSTFLSWLPQVGAVTLSASTALVGHDCWADGRLGDYAHSEILLNDYLLISELAWLGKAQRLAKLHQLGDEAADHFRRVLPPALKRSRRVMVLTHAPPFREACWYQGRISSDQWLPHLGCKAVGDVLRELMRAHPDRELTVLCGHTHGGGEAQILPNLRVYTGAAVYGAPAIQRMLTVGD